MYTQNLRQLLYSLKRKYDTEIQVQRYTASNYDTETGLKTVAYTGFIIYKAVLLPSRHYRAVSPDTLGITNFVLGNLIDVNIREVLIDVRDLPYNYQLATTDWLIVGDERYEIVKVERVQDVAYYVQIKAAAGVHREKLHIVTVKTAMEVANEL